MGASVCFCEISHTARSIFLTSGTLKPIYTFRYDLGTRFEILKTISHVADVKKQLIPSFATKCLTNIPFMPTSDASEWLPFGQELKTSVF